MLAAIPIMATLLLLVGSALNRSARSGLFCWGVLAWPTAHCAAAASPPDQKAAMASGKPARFVARLLLAAQPVLVTPVLQVVHRVITRHLLEQTGFKAD